MICETVKNTGRNENKEIWIQFIIPKKKAAQMGQLLLKI